MLTKNLINNLESHKIDKIANLFLFHISTDPNFNKRKFIFLVVVCAPIIIIGIIKYLLFFFFILKTNPCLSNDGEWRCTYKPPTKKLNVFIYVLIFIFPEQTYTYITKNRLA